PAWTDEWFVNPTDVDPDFELEPSAQDPAQWQEVSLETVAREYLDRSATMLPDELAELQATFYRSWGNAAGEMLARAMDELALKIRMTDATTPAEFADRVDALDAEVRAGWEKIGYENGQAAAARPQYDIDDLAARRGRPNERGAYGAF